ncbi:hypothetical protein ACFLUG_00595 [Chloroflexota bacterium]
MKTFFRLLMILALLLGILLLSVACDDDYNPLPTVGEDAEEIFQTGGEPGIALSVLPREVMPGEDIEINAYFYPEQELELVLWVDGDGFGPFYTDEAGYFYGVFTIDPSSPPGEYMLTVEYPGPGMQASEFYTVTDGMVTAPSPTQDDVDTAEFSTCNIVVTGSECGMEVTGVTGAFSGTTFSGEVSFDLNASSHRTQSVTVVLDESFSKVLDFQVTDTINYDPPEDSLSSGQKKRQTGIIGNDVPLIESDSSGIFSDTLAFEINGSQVIQHISMVEDLRENYSGDREVSTMDHCQFDGSTARIKIVIY